MKVAFYKGKGRLFNAAVRWWTQSPHSHCEIVMDNGLSIGSSYRDGGVRRKMIDYAEHSDRWDFIDIGPETPERLARIDSMFGMKYDLRGILGMVWRAAKEDKRKVFCSDFVACVEGLPDSWRFDPGLLHGVLQFIYEDRNKAQDGR